MSWFKRGRGKSEEDPVAWASDETRTGPAGDVGGGPTGEQAAGDDDGGPLASAFRRAAGTAAGSASGDTGDGAPADARPSPDDDPVGGRRRSKGQEGSSPGDPEPDGEGGEGGPWDVSQVEGPEGLVDLGALWVPGREGMELRLEVEEDTGRVTAATVALGGSAVQLQAFAAPRSGGIWADIRAEIAAGVTRQGGTADEMPGRFGQELLARIPVHAPDGATSHQPARFVGVDGPRWFLRAVFHGPAAYQAEAAYDLEALVRGVVVVRGSEAMAPRELLPLQVPQSAVEEEPEVPDAVAARPPLDPFSTGQQITETR